VAEWAIIAGRLLQFSAVSVLFGSSLFYFYGFRAGSAESRSGPRRWARRTSFIAAIVGLLGVVIWVMAQTALISENASDAFNPALVFSMLTETRFGRFCLLRIVLLMASVVILLSLSPGRTLWIIQTFLGGAVLASFAWTGHGVADEGWAGSLHLGSDVLHLLAAGVWIGALVPLSILILFSTRSQTVSEAIVTYEGLESFSGIGPAVVAVLVLTGFLNSWFLIGIEQWRALSSTRYGLALDFKLVLFAFMLLLAAGNRYHLSPRLGRASHERGHPSDLLGLRIALRSLRISVLGETMLALAVLAAVAYLGRLEPPISS
jgi:copper resistance protein D